MLVCTPLKWDKVDPYEMWIINLSNKLDRLDLSSFIADKIEERSDFEKWLESKR